ncbi:MAG: hypothetical protein AAFZ17_09555, partial [Cyanobacteria bacterium J06650_10]
SVQGSAIANPFGGLTDAIEEVNNTVETVENVADTFQTITNLSETLGLSDDLNLSIGDSDPVGQVMELYGLWFTEMPSSEQEVATWLITELASNEITSLDALSSSDWFSQKPASEQSQVAETFGKIQTLFDATGQDSSRFLGYASCISDDTSNCSI